jgi:hypothetical protein
VNDDWTNGPTRVLVEVCDFRLDSERLQGRRHGSYVETHARYKIVDEGTGSRPPGYRPGVSD